MKINKKILIPVFATAMGLSVIGGVSGAVAWYQYNSKVTSSFIGFSVADTGVLQIKNGESGAWTRAVKNESASNKLRPVTFGKTDDGIGTKQAWMYPEAGAGKGYYEGAANKAGWVKAEKGTDYYQFDLYFNALQTDAAEEDGYKYVEREVYLNNYFVRCLNKTSHEEITDSSKIAEKALRVQIDVDAQNKHLILGKEAKANLALSGKLDLDASGTADKYHKTPFNVLPDGAEDEAEIVYGVEGDTQTVAAMDDYKGESASKLFKTSGVKDNPVHVVITIWLEGWDLLDSSTARAEWNPFTSSDCEVQVAFEFTTGIFRGENLTPVTPNP